MKETRKKLILLTAIAASIHSYNKYINTKATSKNLLKDEKGTYYKWKSGNIYYTKEGNGSPILLIHDIQPSSSSYEWKRIISRLKKTNTVYTLDLLGCGRSDKPKVTYTSYMYVQLLTAFIKDIIQEKTDVVASNLSSSFVLMTDRMDDSLFNHIILINPVSIKQMQATANKITKFKKILINLPLIGTFLYNINMSPKIMDLTFRKRYSSDISQIPSEIIDVYYESAHLKKEKGKYLYSSILGNYMNINIYQSIKNTKKTINIIYSQKLKKALHTVNDYHKVNSNIYIKGIESGSPYPQIKDSYQVCNAIKNIIHPAD